MDAVWSKNHAEWKKPDRGRVHRAPLYFHESLENGGEHAGTESRRGLPGEGRGQAEGFPGGGRHLQDGGCTCYVDWLWRWFQGQMYMSKCIWLYPLDACSISCMSVIPKNAKNYLNEKQPLRLWILLVRAMRPLFVTRKWGEHVARAFLTWMVAPGCLHYSHTQYLWIYTLSR